MLTAKVVMVILACKGVGTGCIWLETIPAYSRYLCSLRRPAVSMIYQAEMQPGWYVFTRCKTVMAVTDG